MCLARYLKFNLGNRMGLVEAVSEDPNSVVSDWDGTKAPLRTAIFDDKPQRSFSIDLHTRIRHHNRRKSRMSACHHSDHMEDKPGESHKHGRNALALDMHSRHSLPN